MVLPVSVMAILLTAAAVVVVLSPQAGARLSQCLIAGTTSEADFVVGKLGHKVQQAKSVLAIKVGRTEVIKIKLKIDLA